MKELNRVIKNSIIIIIYISVGRYIPTFNALYKEIVKNKNLSPNKNDVTDIIISINNAKALFMFLGKLVVATIVQK